MHIPDKAVGIFVKFVIVVVPALIGTELLVGSALKNITAVETISFHELMF